MSREHPVCFNFSGCDHMLSIDGAIAIKDRLADAIEKAIEEQRATAPTSARERLRAATEAMSKPIRSDELAFSPALNYSLHHRINAVVEAWNAFDAEAVPSPAENDQAHAIVADLARWDRNPERDSEALFAISERASELINVLTPLAKEPSR